MSKIIENLSAVLRQIPTAVVVQQNGIAFLSMVPFMLSSITLAQRDALSLQYLMTSTPQSFSLLPALFLVVLTLVALIRGETLLAVPPFLSAILLLAIALKRTLGFNGTAQEVDGAANAIDTIIAAVTYPALFDIYTICVAATVIGVVLRPTMSRWLFRTVALILIADTILFTFGSAHTILGPLFQRYVPSQVSVLTSLLALLFLRMIVKFLQENASHLRDARALSKDAWKDMVRAALWLWWPMLVVFAVFGFAYHWLDDRYIKQPLIASLNTYEVNNEVRIYPRGPEVPPQLLEREFETVETASKGAMEYFIAQQYAQIAARINEEVDAADNTADQVMETAGDIFPRRFPGTHPADCSFGDLKCVAANIAKSTINSSYLAARRSILAELRVELDELGDTASVSGEDAKALIAAKLGHLSDLTRQLITETATGLRYLGWAAFAYSVVILIKSLMIVFARVFHSQVATTPAASGLESQKRIGKMKRLGPRVALNASDGISQYYVIFKACGNNVVDRRRIPQPTKLVLRRLFAKNLTMCLIDFDADKTIDCCDLIVDPPAEITRWDLLEGDEIFVDMSAVIGFSRSCALDRRISLSLGALIFGRAIYHSISGPGRVYLRTDNAPLAATDPGTFNVMQSSSLVAWRRDTGFHVKSALTVSDTFFSGYSIRKADARPHLVLYDTSQSRRVGTGGGIARMARAFLLPF